MNDKVKVTWSEPINNGSPITAYKILIQQKQLTFAEESVDCIGGSPTLISERTCSIALTGLRAAPYLLTKGDSVVAQILSINLYGESTQIVTGSGAVIRDLPDAPVSLFNDPTITTDKLIRFTWSDGLSNGGTAIIDYTVLYDQGSNSFVQLAAGVTNRYYQTTANLLTAGVTYVFKVKARTSVGLSEDSASVSILAATIPDAPLFLSDSAL